MRRGPRGEGGRVRPHDVDAVRRHVLVPPELVPRGEGDGVLLRSDRGVRCVAIVAGAAARGGGHGQQGVVVVRLGRAVVGGEAEGGEDRAEPLMGRWVGLGDGLTQKSEKKGGETL